MSLKQLPVKQFLFGLITFFPGLRNVLKIKGTGGTDSARYCYSVWLRHLVMAKNNGLNPYPKVIAELGPGDSLGIGLAALIAGCEKYFAFDVVAHADPERNLKIFEELVLLFRNRADIPGENEFPKVKPYLSSYDFPYDILTDEILGRALNPSRIEKIRDAITKTQMKNSIIQYKVSWHDKDLLEKETVDMIFSQAVLEHVDELKNAYEKMYLWLKPGGYVSHQIDFKSHGTARDWNGHWTYSDFVWKLLKGKRPYLINREFHSTHIALLEETGFKVACDLKVKTESELTKNDLATRYQSMPEDALTISGVFIQAVKPHK